MTTSPASSAPLMGAPTTRRPSAQARECEAPLADHRLGGLELIFDEVDDTGVRRAHHEFVDAVAVHVSDAEGIASAVARLESLDELLLDGQGMCAVGHARDPLAVPQGQVGGSLRERDRTGRKLGAETPGEQPAAVATHHRPVFALRAV